MTEYSVEIKQTVCYGDIWSRPDAREVQPMCGGETMSSLLFIARVTNKAKSSSWHQSDINHREFTKPRAIFKNQTIHISRVKCNFQIL